MNAFDALEAFRDVVGSENYGSEFVRLKQLSRKSKTFILVEDKHRADSSEASTVNVNERLQSLFWSKDDSTSDQNSPEAELGKLLDKSRRHILHYFGKIVLFEKQGLLRHANVLEFPGPARSAHAVSLLEPLVLETELYCGKITSKCERAASVFAEHHSVFRGLKKLYSLHVDESSIQGTKNKNDRKTCR